MNKTPPWGRYVLYTLVSLASWVVPSLALAQASVATDIRIGIHSDRTRLVVDLSDEVNPHIFALPDPYRIVVDLPQIDWQIPADAIQHGGVIEAFRYGLLEAGVSRMVLDLKQPAKVVGSFVLPPSEGKAYRLVVDLSPTDRAGFMEALGAPDTPQAAMRAPSVAPPGAPARKPEHGRKKVVVIDPGHGGVDPGTIGPRGVYEKDITLAAARQFKQRLDQTGRYEVYLTRNSDIFIRLRDRIAIARAKGADLFISLHVNSNTTKSIRGLSIYTLSEKASDKEAAQLADKENKADVIAGIDLTSENPEVTNILIDLAQRETMNSSAHFASELVSEFKPISKILPKAHRFAGFAVLKAPDVPSVLIEMGFLTNPQDARELLSSTYRGKMAGALSQAVDRYFQSVEKADRN